MNTTIYEMTLPIVGTQNLIVGVTLLVLCFAKQSGRVHNKLGLVFFALAMLAISAINFGEYATTLHGPIDRNPLSVVMFAASIELFLFLFAYVSMLDRTFVTTRRICIEIGLLVTFTLPPPLAGLGRGLSVAVWRLLWPEHYFLHHQALPQHIHL